MRAPWLALLIGVLALLVHARARWGDFTFHDDYRYVVGNEAIDHVGNPARFFTDLSTLAQQSPTTDIYRPVRTLSYAVITALSGKESAAPFHAAAILLHAGTAVALFVLLLRAELGRFPAAAGALFFAFSPVTVEVTAWVCSLGDAWCGFFAAASMLAYAADRRVVALLALVLALFSKEHAVVVPGLWLLWDWFLRPERLRGDGRSRTLLAGAVPGLAAVAAFLVFRGVVAGAQMKQVAEPMGGSHWTAGLTMTAGLGWYAATILFPYGPTFDAVVDVRETPFDAGVFLGLVVLAALVWAVVRGPARVRLGAAWFLVALVPVHNVFVPLKIPTADRFLYLPLMGLSLVVAELARRTYPFSARWMPVALLLLAVLSVARIGDWRGDEALLAAGQRVAPKSHRLIWTEGFIAANRAASYLRAGDLYTGERLAAEAVDKYQLYLRNSQPAEQTLVFVEMGNVYFEVGEARALRAPEARREPKSRALEAYVQARRLHREGIGQATDEQQFLVADRIVQLSTELAEPKNPDIGRTIQVGLEAAHFLKERFGIDDTGTRVHLRLADSVRIRGNEPAKAREGFTWVLDTLGKLEKGDTRYPFIRAQALFYRAILRDQDYNRADIELAYNYYWEAAREPAHALRALAYAARCLCTIGSLFHDAEQASKGKRLLQSIPAVAADKKLRLDEELKNDIASLEAGCGR